MIDLTHCVHCKSKVEISYLITLALDGISHSLVTIAYTMHACVTYEPICNYCEQTVFFNKSYAKQLVQTLHITTYNCHFF